MPYIPQEGGWVHCASANLGVVWQPHDAALSCPIVLQPLDSLLKGGCFAHAALAASAITGCVLLLLLL